MSNWRRTALYPFLGPSSNAITKLNRTTTVACWDSSIDASGNLLDISGNARHLSPTHAPTTAVSAFQMSDGNKWTGRNFDGTNDYYSLAHASWMNMFSTNFTFTTVAKLSSTAVAAGEYMLSHMVANTSGIYFGVNTIFQAYAAFVKSGSTTTLAGTTALNDDKYHVFQIVRSSSIVKLFVDGVIVAIKDVSTYGIDGSATLYLGSYTTTTYPWNGDILYTRLDAEALTDAQLAKELSILRGDAVGTVWSASADFARASTAYQTFSDKTMALRPAGMPRVGDGVLVEGAATQLLTYTGAFSTNWTKSGTCTISGTSVVLPDGTTGTTNTFHEGTDVATTHSLGQTDGAFAIGTSYCYSKAFKYNPSASTPREFVRLFINDTVKDSVAYFNIRYGFIGTTAGNATIKGYGIKSLGNSWFICYVWLTAESAGNGYCYMSIAEADADVTFTGQNQDSVFIWGPQLETGTFPTSYIPRLDATAAARSADDFNVLTYRLRNTLQRILTTTPTMAVDFGQDPSGATITSDVGSYTLTKGDQPKAYDSPIYGKYHSFNGTSDGYSITKVSLPTPTGDFSIVAAITPHTTAAGDGPIYGTWKTSDNTREFTLTRNGSSIIFKVSTNGTNEITATVSNALAAYKPALITASWSTTAGIILKVDALTVVTQAGTGTVNNSANTLVYVARDYTATFSNCKIHNIYYFNGTALTQANHNSLYAAWKNAGLLPLTVGSTSHYKKLKVSFDYLGLAASQTGPLVEISGSLGSAGSNVNRLIVSMATTTLRASLYANGETTERFCTYTVAHNRWNHVELVLNMADLTAVGGTAFTVNDAAGTLDATMTGAKTISTLDTRLRVGQDYLGTTFGNATIKNLQVLIADS
jgi:hypothetical protein